MIKRKKAKEVFSNSLGTLFNDHVLGRTGQPGRYLRWKWARQAVSIVPVKNGRLALAKMYRYPIKETSLEFPRGGLGKNETVRQGGLRELKEETGLVGRKTEIMGSFYADTGLIQNVLTVLLIEVVGEDNQQQEEFEAITKVYWFEPKKIRQKILNGDLQCGITISSFFLYEHTRR